MNNPVLLSQPLSPVQQPVFHAPAWTVDTVLDLFELPFADLIFRAQQALREHFNPNAIQRSSLLSVKTGNCSEDCGYCSQSKRYQTGLETQRLLSTEDVLAAA
ncbi:MAG: biotin synthase BioB, partial [Rhodoferax sp.]|nr:biotin synthase BioB [Rhodoferax sp.]